MRKAPAIYNFEDLKTILQLNVTKSSDGETWYVARPLGYYSIKNRIKCAWLAFAGKADLLIWPDNQ